MTLDLVDQTLQIWRSTPFKWGDRDCMLSIADYLHLITGEDYGAKYRGTYHDEQGAMQHIEAIGGDIAMIDQSGLPWTDAPKRGDICLVDFAGREFAGIFTVDAVAFRAEQGVKEISSNYLEFIQSWSVS